MWNHNRKPTNGYQQAAYNPGTAAPQTPQMHSFGQSVAPNQYQQQQQMPPQNTHPQTQAPQYIPQQSPSPAQPKQFEEAYIDGTISRFATNKACMDFSDRLVKAMQKDFANIHGCGGKDHAPNSGIRLAICDYSKGTGESSVSVHFNIDVRDISYLRSAAEAAAIGTLGLTEQLKAVREFATANGVLIGWLQSNHQPTLQDVAMLQQTVCNGLMAQDPDNLSADKVLWEFETLKTNPHKSACKMIDGVEHTPVSTLKITYCPAKKYPWTLHVSNFTAPIVRNKNGSSYSVNSKAIEKKEAMFPMSKDDFFHALSDVEHYISLWEYRMYPVVNAMCNEKERRAEEKRQQAAAR